MPTIAEAVRRMPSAPPVMRVEEHVAGLLADLREVGIPVTVATVLARATDTGLPSLVVAEIGRQFSGPPGGRLPRG